MSEKQAIRERLCGDCDPALRLREWAGEVLLCPRCGRRWLITGPLKVKRPDGGPA